MRHDMFDSLTDLNILEKADELFTDGYNATSDFLFGESSDPNGTGDDGISGSRLINKGLGYRIRREIADAVDPNEALKALFSARTPFFEYPLGLTPSFLGDSSTNTGRGPYVEFYAFEYERNAEGTRLRRSASSVSTAATGRRGYVTPGVKPLFTVALPFRGNVKRSAVANIEAVDTLVNKVINAANGEDFSGDAQAAASAVQNASAGEQVGIGVGAVGAALATSLLAKARNSQMAGDVKAQLSLTAGVAINPSMEMLYTSPDINTHTFEFTFVPVSANEAQMVNNILHNFQSYALPEEIAQLASGANGALLSFPAMFEIRFFSAKGKKLRDIIDIPDCTLRNVDVVYDPTGTGRLTTDDRPVSYRLSLTFTENKIMTRNDYHILKYGKHQNAAPITAFEASRL